MKKSEHNKTSTVIDSNKTQEDYLKEIAEQINNGKRYDIENPTIKDIKKLKDFDLDKNTFNQINYKVAKNEALVSGEFRDSQVRIGGTDYIPPKSYNLDNIFTNELPIIIDRCNTKTELAFELFLWMALNQFYYDGNKRTGRLI